MQNLVVNHIYLTLGIAGLVSMILTGCAIEADEALCLSGAGGGDRARA